MFLLSSIKEKKCFFCPLNAFNGFFVCACAWFIIAIIIITIMGVCFFFGKTWAEGPINQELKKQSKDNNVNDQHFPLNEYKQNHQE